MLSFIRVALAIVALHSNRAVTTTKLKSWDQLGTPVQPVTRDLFKPSHNILISELPVDCLFLWKFKCPVSRALDGIIWGLVFVGSPDFPALLLIPQYPVFLAAFTPWCNVCNECNCVVDTYSILTGSPETVILHLHSFTQCPLGGLLAWHQTLPVSCWQTVSGGQCCQALLLALDVPGLLEPHSHCLCVDPGETFF